MFCFGYGIFSNPRKTQDEQHVIVVFQLMIWCLLNQRNKKYEKIGISNKDSKRHYKQIQINHLNVSVSKLLQLKDEKSQNCEFLFEHRRNCWKHFKKEGRWNIFKNKFCVLFMSMVCAFMKTSNVLIFFIFLVRIQCQPFKKIYSVFANLQKLYFKQIKFRSFVENLEWNFR